MLIDVKEREEGGGRKGGRGKEGEGGRKRKRNVDDCLPPIPAPAGD